MKLFQRAVPRLFLLIVTLYGALTVGIIGCGDDDSEDDDNMWVGTWSLETYDGQGLEQVLEQELAPEGVAISIVTNNWTFHDDETLEAEISFRFGNQGSESAIALTSTLKTSGTYSLSGSNYTLTLEDIPIAALKESTGTWSREGNTLILNSDDGDNIAFKKK